MRFFYVLTFFRRLFVAVDPEAEAAQPERHEAQHHLPDLRLSPGLRGLVLPQRGHLLHRQDRRLHPVQLRVSRRFQYERHFRTTLKRVPFINSFLNRGLNYLTCVLHCRISCVFIRWWRHHPPLLSNGVSLLPTAPSANQCPPHVLCLSNKQIQRKKYPWLLFIILVFLFDAPVCP